MGPNNLTNAMFKLKVQGNKSSLTTTYYNYFWTFKDRSLGYKSCRCIMSTELMGTRPSNNGYSLCRTQDISDIQ